MLTQLRPLWWRLTSGLWFLPAITVVGAILLGIGLVEADSWMQFELPLSERWPRLFGAGDDGSRAMLTAIASSMITVAGVVFSMTIVALSLAASQYSPRVLRTFTRDRPTQLVLGVFVGIFAYCLVVLRTIRGGDGQQFVPSLAVLGGLVLALVGIAFLVYFIHHLAASIQASSILARVTQATLKAVDELFPEDLGAWSDEREPEPEGIWLDAWSKVPARRSGYVISVSKNGLLSYARARARVLRMEVEVGDFVIEGQPLASLRGNDAVNDADALALNANYSFERQRTIEQDVSFGLQQIVDIGTKALSPGINDASTAVLCIDRLTQILSRLARRRIERPFRREEGELRVLVRGPSFGSLVDLAYNAVRRDGATKPQVITRLLWSIQTVADNPTDPSRRLVLAAQAGHIVELARGAQPLPEWREILSNAAVLEERLNPLARAHACTVGAGTSGASCATGGWAA